MVLKLVLKLCRQIKSLREETEENSFWNLLRFNKTEDCRELMSNSNESSGASHDKKITVPTVEITSVEESVCSKVEVSETLETNVDLGKPKIPEILEKRRNSNKSETVSMSLSQQNRLAVSTTSLDTASTSTDVDVDWVDKIKSEHAAKISQDPAKFYNWLDIQSTIIKFSSTVSSHSYFENLILLMIFASTAALCLEDKNLPNRPTLQQILNIPELAQGLFDRLPFFILIVCLEKYLNKLDFFLKNIM